MKISGTNESTLYQALEAANVLYSGNITFKREPETRGKWVHFTLTVRKSAEHGGRRSQTGRKIAAACWHAHRDFMQALFVLAPDSRLVTAFADYDGRDGFLADFPETGDRNIGSQVNPMAMSEACECEYHPMPADSIDWDTIHAEYHRNGPDRVYSLSDLVNLEHAVAA